MKKNEGNCSRTENGNRINKEYPNGGNYGNEKLGIWIGTTEASFTNRIQEMEERIPGIGDTIEEIGKSVKKNIKSKKLQSQSIMKSGTL